MLNAWCRRIRRKKRNREKQIKWLRKRWRVRDQVKEREIKYLNSPAECLAWCRSRRRKERNREEICHMVEKDMECEREREK